MQVGRIQRPGMGRGVGLEGWGGGLLNIVLYGEAPSLAV